MSQLITKVAPQDTWKFAMEDDCVFWPWDMGKHIKYYNIYICKPDLFFKVIKDKNHRNQRNQPIPKYEERGSGISPKIMV